MKALIAMLCRTSGGNRVCDAALALFVGAGASLITAARLATSGISLTPDSLSYLYAASHAFEHGSLLSLNGPPDSLLTIFPPAFPALIAVFGIFTPTHEDATAVINVLCMFFSSAITYYLLRQFGVRPLWSCGLSLAIFLHPSIQRIFWFAWSEGLYILISVSLMFYLSKLNGECSATYGGLVVGAFVALGFLTRYAGISLLPAGLVGLACVVGWPQTRRVRAMTFAVSFSCIVLAIWIVRNHFVDGTTFGSRGVSEDSVSFALQRLLVVAGELVLPIDRFKALWIILGTLTLTIIVVVIATNFRKSERFGWRALSALTLALSHSVLIVYSQATTIIDPIDLRLMSPAIVPLMLVMASIFVDRVQPAMHFRSTVLLAICLTIAGGAGAYASGIWIGAKPWRVPLNTAVARKDVPPACITGNLPTYSNANAYLRFVGAVPNSAALPRQIPYRSTVPNEDWLDFRTVVKSTPVCIVWFGEAADFSPSAEALLGGPTEQVVVTPIKSNLNVFWFIARWKP